MKIKRLISLLLILVLLGGSMPVLAANAGSRQDPLLSRSYVQTWSSDLLARVEETARTAVQAALDKALQTYDASLSTGAGKSRICTLFAGNTVELKTGDCFTVLSGDAAVSVASGALVDATDGRQVATGALQTAHRYIACENVQATITCTQGGTLLLSAGAYVTRYVDVPATAWYAPYVEYATVNKLMSGIGNDLFDPAGETTRAMLVSMLYRMAGEPDVSGTALPFTDVAETRWSYPYIKDLYDAGVVSGTSATTFSPAANVTRAQFVTMLAGLAGADVSNCPATPFRDVPEGAWYAPYVNWALANGIVSGYSVAAFGPNDGITREQLATMLYEYAKYKGYDVTKAADLSGFVDQGSISAYAVKPMQWAVAQELIFGVGGSAIAPQAAATRAQLAAVLHRFCEAFA